MTSFTDLPPDVHCEVFKKLSIENVAAASQCCRALLAASTSDELWRGLCARDFFISNADVVKGPKAAFIDHHGRWRAFNRPIEFSFEETWLVQDRSIPGVPTFRYKGTNADAERSDTVGVVTTSLPLTPFHSGGPYPPLAHVYYFEVAIVDGGARGTIGIGFCPRAYHLRARQV